MTGTFRSQLLRVQTRVIPVRPLEDSFRYSAGQRVFPLALGTDQDDQQGSGLPSAPRRFASPPLLLDFCGCFASPLRKQSSLAPIEGSVEDCALSSLWPWSLGPWSLGPASLRLEQVRRADQGGAAPLDAARDCAGPQELRPDTASELSPSQSQARARGDQALVGQEVSLWQDPWTGACIRRHPQHLEREGPALGQAGCLAGAAGKAGEREADEEKHSFT